MKVLTHRVSWYHSQKLPWKSIVLYKRVIFSQFRQYVEKKEKPIKVIPEELQFNPRGLLVIDFWSMKNWTF